MFLYTSILLFDLVYKKDGNFYLKVFEEKVINNFFRRKIINIGLWGFGSSSRNTRNDLSLGLESSHFFEIQKIF